MTAEVDFLRGGSIDVAKIKKTRKILFREDGKKGDKSKKTEKPGDSKGKDGAAIVDGIFRKPLTAELLTSGVRALGIVKKINDLNVVLECAGGVHVSLHGSAISRAFTDSLKTTDKTLEDLFTIGQAIAFKVLKQKKESSGKWRIDVTTCPHALNSHLMVVNLVERLVLNASVISVEERGVVLDMGVSGKVTAFLPIDELPSFIDLAQLCVGQVLMVRVKANAQPTTRVVPVSGVPEVLDFRSDALEPNQLMPGMIMKGEPQSVRNAGAVVVLPNNLKGFVHYTHMPAQFRLRGSDGKLNLKSLRVCVLACQQNSPLLILSANADVLALSKPANRHLPERYRVGSKINCKVHRAMKNGSIYFSVIPDDDDEADGDQNGNVSTLLVKTPRAEIDTPDKNLKKFPKNSIHLCRVIAFRAVDRMLIVSTRKETLKKAVTGPADLVPGRVYMLTVTDIRPSGLSADCCGVKCSVPALHVRDRPTKKWERGYRVGQTIKCRFLHKAEHHRYPTFTAKPALVESKERIIAELNETLVGEVAVGTVIKQLEGGHLLIAFYNNVAGILRDIHVQKLSNVYLGMPVKVRVVLVKPEERKLALDLGEEFLDSVITAEAPRKRKAADEMVGGDAKEQESEESKPKRIKKCFKAAKPFGVYTAMVVGQWPYGGTSPATSIELLLNGGTIGRLHVSELDLSTFADGQKPVETFLERNRDRTVNVKVICVGQHKTISVEGKAGITRSSGTDRFVECTMNPEKVSETRRKLNLINFRSEFHYDDVVPTFYVGRAQGARNGEVNLIFRAIINESEYPDLEIGALIRGRVTGVNSTSRSKCVLIGEEEKDRGSEKDAVTTLKRSRKDSLKSEVTVETVYVPGKSKAAIENDAKKPTADPKSKRPIFVKISDPGFDWTTTGFTVDDLMKVSESGAERQSLGDANEDEPPKKSKRNYPSISLDDALESMSGVQSVNYTKLIADDPNSVEPWIRCVVHFIAKENYEKAKEVIEKALKVINFKNSEDIHKLWIVYINLEVLFGSEESLKIVFEKACGAANSLQMHKHLASMYKKFSKNDEATDVFESMIKKYRLDDLEVWYLYGEHLLEINEPEKCRELLQRALQSLDKKHHVLILCRFAQLEYKHGDAQRGRTMFEKIVYTYENKVQAWSLFVDMVVKYEGIEAARKVFDRAIAAVGHEKSRSLLKKFVEAEQKYGDADSQNALRERMSNIAKSLKSIDS